MADKDFKVKTGLDLGTPLPLTEGGTGQTSASNALNALLPLQTGNSLKFLQTDGSSVSWVTAAVANNSIFTGSAMVIPSGGNADRPLNPQIGSIRLNTDQGTLEFWTGSSWGAIATFPQPPRNLVATDIGTSRAFNNGSMTVSFDVPIGNGGSTITSYKITSNPGSFVQTVNVPSTTATFTGLSSNTNYTFTGTSINSIGEGGSSSASSAVLATTIPQAPTIGTPTVTNTTTVSVPFTAGATGGKSVTYTVNSNIGSFTGTGSSSPITVTGAFGNGTSYTFTVTATNENGSATSSASSLITPSPAYSLSSTFNSSGTYTVPSGKTQMAVFLMGGGNPGSQGEIGSGGAGGRSGAVIGFKDYSVTPGQNYSVVVGGAGGGASSFGNIANVGLSANLYPSGASAVDGVYGGNQGVSGSSGASVNLNDAFLPTFTSGGSGGGGARPGYGRQLVDYGNVTYYSPGSAGLGGSGGGGNGGSPGTISGTGFGTTTAGGSGGAANGRGAGGGGGGGGGYGMAYEGYLVTYSNGGSGGAGQPGQVVVYVR